MQRRKTSYRENTPGNAFQSQSCCPPVADQLQGVAEKTPGIRSGRKNSAVVQRRKHRNARVTPLREGAMNAKPLKLLLLEDRRKDARFLQKAIKDGGSFGFKLVKIDKLEKTISAVKEKPEPLVLSFGDSSA